MTRFLSRIWDDPECGGLNKDTERLFAYHQATKHTYHSVRSNARVSTIRSPALMCQPASESRKNF